MRSCFVSSKRRTQKREMRTTAYNEVSANNLLTVCRGGLEELMGPRNWRPLAALGTVEKTKPLAVGAWSSRARVELIGRMLRRSEEGMPEVSSRLQSTRDWALADSKQRLHLFPRSWPESLQRTTAILRRPAVLRLLSQALSPPCFFCIQLSGLGPNLQVKLWSGIA